jgi:hypothetical protein
VVTPGHSKSLGKSWARSWCPLMVYFIKEANDAMVPRHTIA